MFSRSKVKINQDAIALLAAQVHTRLNNGVRAGVTALNNPTSQQNVPKAKAIAKALISPRTMEVRASYSINASAGGEAEEYAIQQLLGSAGAASDGFGEG